MILDQTPEFIIAKHSPNTHQQNQLSGGPIAL